MPDPRKTSPSADETIPRQRSDAQRAPLPDKDRQAPPQGGAPQRDVPPQRSVPQRSVPQREAPQQRSVPQQDAPPQREAPQRKVPQREAPPQQRGEADPDSALESLGKAVSSPVRGAANPEDDRNDGP
jgi:hypothetical protein